MPQQGCSWAFKSDYFVLLPLKDLFPVHINFSGIRKFSSQEKGVGIGLCRQREKWALATDLASF